MFAFVERVHVIDDRERAAIEHVPERFVRDHHRASDHEANLTRLQPVGHRAPLGGRDAAVHFTDAETRALEAVAEILAILAHEVARGSHETHVAAAAKRFGDRRAEHHFGLAGTGWRLEQKLELALGELRRNLADRACLVVGQREALAGLDQIVREGHDILVGLDAFPNRARRVV